MVLPGERLRKCASFVREGALFADIGTDHGYLPIYLLLSGKAASATAADIGEKPLEAARKNAAVYSADLKLILSDGFENIPPDDFTDACLAGMGGELMVKIISSAIFLKEPSPSLPYSKKRLILQPQSHERDLRKFLSENGWAIICEECCCENHRVYTVICAEPAESSSLSEEELYMGKILPGSPYSGTYAEKQIKQIRNRLKGIPQEDALYNELSIIADNIEKRYLLCPQ